jgi:hypothetical protein
MIYMTAEKIDTELDTEGKLPWGILFYDTISSETVTYGRKKGQETVF